MEYAPPATAIILDSLSEERSRLRSILTVNQYTEVIGLTVLQIGGRECQKHAVDIAATFT
jgi:hypothetical protein